MTDARAQSPYSERFTEIFSTLEDPRRTSKGNITYPFIEILFLTISSVLCGYSDFTCIEEFGELNIDWLKKFYQYSSGICSHDVLGKLFQKINYEAFSACVINWAKQCYKFTDEELIAIDGKRICGSYDTASGTLASHIVSAYMSSQEICIGQVATEQKSNEITAIPNLLDCIDVEGAVISIDAMGCQKDIAEKIVSKKANYLLAVKDNQKNLHEEMQDIFENKLPFTQHSTLDNNHGRVEKRTATVLNDVSLLSEKEGWKNLNCLVKIDTERYIKSTKTTSYETRYYISSCINYTAEQMNGMVRQHWAIENKLHWQLDVNFGEDDARKRKGNAAKNFNLISKVALALLQRDKEHKRSIKRKKLHAAFDLKYREKIMKV